MGCQVIEATFVPSVKRLPAGERLPAPDREIYVARIKLDCEAATPACLGCNECRARSTEGIVDEVAWL